MELNRIEKAAKAAAASPKHLKGAHEATKQLKALGRLKGTSVWELIESYPADVRPVCYALAAMPVTQVSVERLFSAMKLLITNLRSRLKEDAVEAMLLLRTN